MKCCICTYKVSYAINLKRSEQTYTVVNVYMCFVLHRGCLFPEILRCSAAKTLLEKVTRLMQIVNYTTWIILLSTESKDPHKVSITLLFDVNLNVALSLAQSKCSNLVDPASSHMLVLKINPCMCKYKYCTAKLRMAHYISYNLFDNRKLHG